VRIVSGCGTGDGGPWAIICRVETRTKERLTGALIIIALLVVLVPEMLSGPHPPLEAGPAQAPQATVVAPVLTYELPVANQPAATGSDQSALMPQVAAADTPALPPPTPVVAVPAPEPVAAVVAETPAQPPAVEKPVSGSRASKPANTKTQAAKTQAAKSRAWTVQVGSFVKRDNAQHLMQDLKAKGFASQLSEDTKARLFRVKAGPVADRAAAQALQARLVAAGYRATISAP
jgi:DedD protein